MERSLGSNKKICLKKDDEDVKKCSSNNGSTNAGESTNDTTTIEILNDDCLVHVFEYLPFSDRIRLERVSKRWCAASRSSWKSVRTFNFSSRLWGSQTVLTRKGLTNVLYLCGKYLKVYDASEFSVTTLEKIHVESTLKLCPNLTSVDFTSVKVGGTFIKSLLTNCKNIIILKMALTTGFAPRAVIDGTILSTYTNLQILHIKSFHTSNLVELPGNWIKFKNTNSIKELHLDSCRKLDDSNLFSVIPQLSNLHTLSLQQSLDLTFIPQNLDFIQQSNIKVLNISNNSRRVDDYFLIKNAVAFSSLTSLNISGNYKVTDNGLNAVSYNLEYLIINKMDIMGSSLSSLPLLKGLSCRGCPYLDVEHMRSLFRYSDRLESLDLREYDNQVASWPFNDVINTAINCMGSCKNDIPLRLYVDTIPNNINLPDNLQLVKLAVDDKISVLTF